MQLLINANALARGTAANVNCSDVDRNRWTLAVAQADALAAAINGMAARGEIEIAQSMVAEFRKARRDAANLARLIGVTE